MDPVRRAARRGVYLYAAIAMVAASAAAGVVYASADAGGDTKTGAAASSSRFTDSGVTVTMTVKNWNGRTGHLETTFAPVRAGFHLYSIALPPDGIGGIGRPTVVTVDGSLTATGPLTATSPVHDLSPAGTGVTLPVYPDGPVTTVLPIRADASGRATVVVGYAACSATQGCMFPVTGHAVDVDVNVSQGTVTLTTDHAAGTAAPTAAG
jgi:hypothetical protein